MNRLHPLSFLKQYRHSKGYGVHSPFAYRFITETLCDRKATYYLDPTLRYNGRGDEKVLKLTLRVLCALKPKSIGLLPNAQSRIRDIIKEVDSEIAINFNNPDMFIVSPDYKNDAKERIVECLERGGNVLWGKYDKEALEIVSGMKHGMTFTNGHSLIAVGRRDLPRQDFNLFF